jgi:hypothetical protein
MKKSSQLLSTIAIVVVLFPLQRSESSFELIPVSSRQEAMGGVCGGRGAKGALWLNPAGATALQRSWFTSSYSRLWGLPELTLSSLFCTYPISIGSVSVGISNLGCTHYRENIGCLSFATRFKSSIDLGMNVKWMHRAIGTEYVDNVVSIDGGLILNPFEELMVEVASHNIGSPTIGVDELHQDLLAGVTYRPSDGLLISLNLLKQGLYPLQFCVGEEFRLTPWFTQRAGAKQNPTAITFGFGIGPSSVELDYAATLHPLLGTTHSFSLSAAKFWGE